MQLAFQAPPTPPMFTVQEALQNLGLESRSQLRGTVELGADEAGSAENGAAAQNAMAPLGAPLVQPSSSILRSAGDPGAAEGICSRNLRELLQAEVAQVSGEIVGKQYAAQAAADNAGGLQSAISALEGIDGGSNALTAS